MRLCQRFDTTSDENSRTVFKVTFYFYGDVLSGWDVVAE